MEYTYKLFYQQVRPSKKLCAVMTVISSNLVSLFFSRKIPEFYRATSQPPLDSSPDF